MEEKKKKGMTYKETGVNYDAMDPFKRKAQLAGRETAPNLKRFGFSEVEWSRGESVYLIETPDSFLALVIEGLGTKNKVAEKFCELVDIVLSIINISTERKTTFFDKIAQCTVAMIVNDMITLGALPLSVGMHLAVGNSEWFEDENRCDDLIRGWKNACMMARCTWGGGETPTLRDIVYPGTEVLSGSAIGVIKPKKRIIKGNIKAGDAIILIMSSGIHANGLTLGRDIAPKLPNGYLTKLSDGKTYAESLLSPTVIYVPLVEDCLNAGIDIHYAVNITGHGWRKLMRLDQPFIYRINEIPEPQPVFKTMQEYGPVDDKEAYGNLNMGAGFALYVDKMSAIKTVDIAQKNGMKAMLAGFIEKSAGGKLVVIEPKGIVFDEKTLSIR